MDKQDGKVIAGRGRSGQMGICVAMKGWNLIAGDVVGWLAVQGIGQRPVYSI